MSVTLWKEKNSWVWNFTFLDPNITLLLLNGFSIQDGLNFSSNSRHPLCLFFHLQMHIDPLKACWVLQEHAADLFSPLFVDHMSIEINKISRKGLKQTDPSSTRSCWERVTCRLSLLIRVVNLLSCISGTLMEHAIKTKSMAARRDEVGNEVDPHACRHQRCWTTQSQTHPRSWGSTHERGLWVPLWPYKLQLQPATQRSTQTGSVLLANS